LALSAYRFCQGLGREYVSPTRARVAVLLHAQVARNLAHALQIEQQLTLENVPLNAVAVPEFDLSGPDSLRPLCRGLAVVVLTDLRRVPQLLLVERERLQVLLTEPRLVKDEASRT